MDKEELPGRLRAHEILASHDFRHLVAKRWTVSGILLVLLFASYYGYVAIIGVDKSFMAKKIGVVTTLGIPLGVGVIVFAFIITAVYVGWANSSYDPEVERLRRQLKED